MCTHPSLPDSSLQHPVPPGQCYARHGERPGREPRTMDPGLGIQAGNHDFMMIIITKKQASEQPCCQWCFICPLWGIQNGSQRNCWSQMGNCLGNSACLSHIQDWVTHRAWHQLSPKALPPSAHRHLMPQPLLFCGTSYLLEQVVPPQEHRESGRREALGP